MQQPNAFGSLPPTFMAKAQAVWNAIARLNPNTRQITLQILPNFFTPSPEITVGGMVVLADGVAVPLVGSTMGEMVVIHMAPGVTHEVLLEPVEAPQVLGEPVSSVKSEGG